MGYVFVTVVLLAVGGAGYYVYRRAKAEIAREDAPTPPNKSTPTAAERSRRRSLFGATATALVIVAAIFWLSFKTLDPCQAMISEARNIARSESGLFGRPAAAIVDIVTGIDMESMSALSCASQAVQFKLGGKEELEEFLRNEAAAALNDTLGSTEE